MAFARMSRSIECAGIAMLAYSLLAACALPASATDLRVEQVPLFQLRARVTSAAGQETANTKRAFAFSLSGVDTTSEGDQWSSWIKFERPQVEAYLKGYPAQYLPLWPVALQLVVTQGVEGITAVEAELQFNEGGEATRLGGRLFATHLGFNVWRDEQQRTQAATMAQYNRRYWKLIENARISPEQRPKLFPIVDRFIGGDQDEADWREGIEHLSAAGFSGIMLPPDRHIRDILLSTGLRRTAWAVYNPPGYAFDFTPDGSGDGLDVWAQQQVKPYLDAGYKTDDMSLFAMSDEPGWYYPQAYEQLRASPTALKRFREYLASQALEPQDLGLANWDGAFPMGRSHARDLTSRRLFYWSQRFFAWDSARHFARSTKALEQAFYAGMPIFTNWNNFSGRLYTPGPVANNTAKQDPDAGMGTHDWFEYAKMRGATMLWTEDWFADAQAYQWSFYCAKLRSAAKAGNIEFGGYVIPRTAGDRKDGIVQKILSVVGHGGKAVKYFVFGPEYVFPSNCYSENAGVLSQMAEAHRMVAQAEDVLWPGRLPQPRVAIVAPRSSELWDAANIPIPHQIQDATNNHLNNNTVDYMAEVFDLYLALQHANIPVAFLAEDELTLAGLKDCQVLYLTEPDVPTEGQQALIDWMRAGGILVTVSGAARFDRYNEPSGLLSKALGITEEPRERLLIPDLTGAVTVGKGTGERGPFTAFGARSKLGAGDAQVLARFDDGSPAIVQRTLGRGHCVHFAWLPGLSYVKSSSETKDKLPVGFSEPLRNWITYAVELAKVEPPARLNQALVESPLLVSPAGGALTLLNWTGASIPQLQVNVRLPFVARSVASVKHGPLPFKIVDGAVSVTLTLDAADILIIKP